MLSRPLCVLALVLPLPAAAAGPFQPPQGCTTTMTVRARACRVSNHYTCTADVPGDKWRADFDQEGMFFLSRTDIESQWVESFDLNPTVRQTLDPGASDPASFTELLGGSDTFAFGLTRDDGEETDVTGFDRLTGKTVVIDGITLQETEFKFTESDRSGAVLRRSKGFEYVNADWRLFFAGPSEWDDGTGYVPIDGSPLQFVFPGEPGFGATQPLFDCDPVLSGLPHSRPVL